MNINYVAIRDEEIIAYFQNYDDAMEFWNEEHILGKVDIKKVSCSNLYSN